MKLQRMMIIRIVTEDEAYKCDLAEDDSSEDETAEGACF